MPVIENIPQMGQSGVAGPKPTEWFETIGLDGTVGYALVVPPGSMRIKTDPTNNLGGLPLYKQKMSGSNHDFSGLQCISEKILFSQFTDGGSTSGTYAMKTTIPIGAFAYQTLIQEVTGFTGDTSAVITIGDGSDVDRYNTGTPNVFVTAGMITAGVPSGTKEHTAVTTVTVTVTSAADFTSVTAGAVTVKVFYIR